MTMTIALAGKGGTGKTTVAALIIKSLMQRSGGPILAIDADPASNLHIVLGMEKPTTIGEIREDMSQATHEGKLGVTISRYDYLSREIFMALEEGERIDLLTMGRPEGPGCYCAINHLLRDIMDDFNRKYPFVVMDNEAGMEHISRRTTNEVDLLLLVTDPTVRGVKTAGEMVDLAAQVEVNVKKTMLVINRVQDELTDILKSAVEGLDLEIAAMIPADRNINVFDATGEPLVNLGDDSPAWLAVDALVSEHILVPVQDHSTA
jgi:CO dehydrogenase maturation factor